MRVVLSPARQAQLLRLACVLGLVGLGLMTWSLFDPRPVPVMVAMSLGQGVGTVSLGLFAAVVLADLRRARVLPPPDPPRDP